MTSTHKLINHLIQLQELVVANMQKKITMPKVRLEELEKSIQALSAQLPPQVKAHFVRLVNKHPEAIVPVFGENCSGCGMALTKSQMQAVQKGETLNRCPNCARFIYYPEVKIERERVSRKWGEARKVGIERFSAPELMIPRLKGSTPEEVLAELCSKMVDEGFVNDREQLLDLSLQREAIVSTAVGSGLAFPHVRGVEGGGLTMALGISRKGIKFGGPGRTLSRIFFFMVIPTATSAFYMKLLSGLSQTFNEKEARDLLLKQKTQEDLWDTLVKLTSKTVK